MRPSRVFRWVVRAFLLVFTLSLSAVSILGGWSAVTILNPASEDIKIGDVDANFYIGNASMDITVPFNITNGGVYELSDIFLRLQVDLTFGNTSTLNNDTTTVQFFNTPQYFGSVLPGQTLIDNYSGNDTVPLSEVDWFRSPYALEFHANLIFSATYSLNLYKVTIAMTNLSLGSYP